MPWRIFTGHPASKQSLTAEDDDAHIAGIGIWARGELKQVTDDVAAFLDATHCFRAPTKDEGKQAGVPAAKSTEPDPSATPTSPSTTTAAQE